MALKLAVAQSKSVTYDEVPEVVNTGKTAYDGTNHS